MTLTNIDTAVLVFLTPLQHTVALLLVDFASRSVIFPIPGRQHCLFCSKNAKQCCHPVVLKGKFTF